MRHPARWLVTSMVTLHLLGFGLVGCDSSNPNPEGMPSEGIQAPSKSDIERLKGVTKAPKKKQ
jgi:hypothetical protein